MIFLKLQVSALRRHEKRRMNITSLTYFMIEYKDIICIFKKDDRLVHKNIAFFLSTLSYAKAIKNQIKSLFLSHKDTHGYTQGR